MHQPPDAALRSLIRTQVRFALEEETLLRVYVQERHTLPRSQTRPLRRAQHEYLVHWDNLVQTLRPDLAPAKARAAVRSVVEMINSVVFYDHELEWEALAELLDDLAWRALIGTAMDGRPTGDPSVVARAAVTASATALGAGSDGRGSQTR